MAAEIGTKIAERAHNFLKEGSTGSYAALVQVIDELFTPNLPAGFDLAPGAFNAYPGTLNAVLNYLAADYGMNDYLSTEMDLETDTAKWFVSMQEIYTRDPGRFNQLAQERLHTVSYPLRVTPLQYLLTPLGQNLVVADMGAAGNIALPLLNSNMLLEQNFQGKEDVVNSLGTTEVSVKKGIGVELTPQDAEYLKWTRAGFWRNASRKDRLAEFDRATAIAAENRNKYPTVQADAMEQTLAPASLDAISAIFTVHQLPNPEQFYEICARILKPNGILMLIGSELIGEFKPTDYPGWRVDIYKNTTEGLQLLATPFYLTENQAGLDRADLAEWQKYLDYIKQ